MKIAVSITDDHPLLRDGLINMIQKHADLIVKAAYANGKELLLGLTDALPDVLLLDFQLPDYTGEALLPLLLKKYPELKVIILTSHESLHTIQTMMRLGARGYILKNAEQELLADAIRKVYEGDVFLSPDIQTKLNTLLWEDRKNSSLLQELTPREKDVLRLIVQEKTARKLAPFYI